jgi:hypothetical protein
VGGWKHHGMSRPGEPLVFGPGVPRWWWRWTPRGRRVMAGIWRRHAAEVRRWEVDGPPDGFETPPGGLVRRWAEDAERMTDVWSLPLHRELLRPHPRGWRRFSRFHRFRHLPAPD